MLLSILFRAPATAALAALSCWLLFAVFWGMIVPLATELIAPVLHRAIKCLRGSLQRTLVYRV
jgi:hypothetical protein